MFFRIIKKTAAVAFWVVIWQLIAVKIALPLILPGPGLVIKRISELVMTPEFWDIVTHSLWRITLGIAVSIVLGVIIGIASARISLVNLLLSPILSLIKATPVASFILLAILWMDSNILPSFISVLIVIPVVVSNISAGIKSTDKELGQVAKVFGFSFFKKVRRLYIPAVYPYFMSSLRSSLGLAWKAGVAAEVLTVPDLSIGKMKRIE